jgi:hypothetical protein
MILAKPGCTCLWEELLASLGSRGSSREEARRDRLMTRYCRVGFRRMNWRCGLARHVWTRTQGLKETMLGPAPEISSESFGF